VRVAGSVLVPAMLVLPGATALLVSKQLRLTVIASATVALLATLIGLALTYRWHFLPTGPLIVLALFAQFVGSYIWGKVNTHRIR
jgi:ABC-type Mn2+/Zn2+ transport system permease subunit